MYCTDMDTWYIKANLPIMSFTFKMESSNRRLHTDDINVFVSLSICIPFIVYQRTLLNRANHTQYRPYYIKEMRREKRFCNHGIDVKDDFGLEAYVPHCYIQTKMHTM